MLSPVVNTALLFLYVGIGYSFLRDFILNRLEVRIRDAASPTILIPLNVPAMTDLVAIAGIGVCLVGVSLVYLHTLRKTSASKTGWWTQGIGFAIVVGAYLFWASDFFNSAGDFG